MLIPLPEAARRMQIPRSTLERHLRMQARGLDAATGAFIKPSPTVVAVHAAYGGVRQVGCPWRFDPAIVDAIGGSGDWLGGANLVPAFLDGVRRAMGIDTDAAIGMGCATCGSVHGSRSRRAKAKLLSENTLPRQSNSAAVATKVATSPIECLESDLGQGEGE